MFQFYAGLYAVADVHESSLVCKVIQILVIQPREISANAEYPICNELSMDRTI